MKKDAAGSNTVAWYFENDMAEAGRMKSLLFCMEQISYMTTCERPEYTGQRDEETDGRDMLTIEECTDVRNASFNESCSNVKKIPADERDSGHLLTDKSPLEHPTANRAYKDTVFRMLFSDKKNLLSLYNAINNSNYQNMEDLEIVTLENAIYMGMKNDLSFIIDMGLYLYEHQSTYNPNMPLRDLFYISSEYQKLVDRKSLYASHLVKIPTPEFFVFYNGTEERPDREELRLSAMYQNQTDDPALELRVTMLNVNAGHNDTLMEQCRTLKEYTQYVATVRRYKETMDLNEAVDRAVTECIDNGILSDFLRKNRAEVISMSIFEYDKEEEEKKLRRTEYEAGREEGREEGVADNQQFTIKQLVKAGMSVERISEILMMDIRTVRGMLTS